MSSATLDSLGIDADVAEAPVAPESAAIIDTLLRDRAAIRADILRGENLSRYSSAFLATTLVIAAVFGAINTMYSAVAARTREIATLRALGFRGGSVVVSVLVESLLLAVARKRKSPRPMRAGGIAIKQRSRDPDYLAAPIVTVPLPVCGGNVPPWSRLPAQPPTWMR